MSGNFCEFGCYWECEHRPPGFVFEDARSILDAMDAATLWPVEVVSGMPIQPCYECGTYIYDPDSHQLDHMRMRHPGWT